MFHIWGPGHFDKSRSEHSLPPCQGAQTIRETHMHTHTHTHAHTHNTYNSTYTCTHAPYTHANIHSCTICMYTCTHTHTHSCTHTTHPHTPHTHTHTHAHTPHMHTHAHRYSKSLGVWKTLPLLIVASSSALWLAHSPSSLSPMTTSIPSLPHATY